MKKNSDSAASLVGIASIRFHVHPALLFKLGLQYQEIRMNAKNAHELYNKDCPSWITRAVEDFALDLLAGRICINTLLKVPNSGKLLKGYVNEKKGV